MGSFNPIFYAVGYFFLFGELVWESHVLSIQAHLYITFTSYIDAPYAGYAKFSERQIQRRGPATSWCASNGGSRTRTSVCYWPDGQHAVEGETHTEIKREMERWTEMKCAHYITNMLHPFSDFNMTSLYRDFWFPPFFFLPAKRGHGFINSALSMDLHFCIMMKSFMHSSAWSWLHTCIHCKISWIPNIHLFKAPMLLLKCRERERERLPWFIHQKLTFVHANIASPSSSSSLFTDISRFAKILKR